MNLWLTSSSPAGRERERQFSAREHKHGGHVFILIPTFFSRELWGGYHGNRWIPGTTLLPAEPPSLLLSSPPSLPPAPTCTEGNELRLSACLNSFHLTSGEMLCSFVDLNKSPFDVFWGFFFFPWENQFRLTSFRPSVTVHMIHRAAVDTRRADKASVRYLKVLKVTDCDFKTLKKKGKF